jgi:hypothetical protein
MIYCSPVLLARTALGQREAVAHVLKLGGDERSLLLQINGLTALKQIQDLKPLKDATQTARSLLALGLIEHVTTSLGCRATIDKPVCAEPQSRP